MTVKTAVPYNVPALEVSGLVGSVAASRYCGATASGAPTTGAHLVGDWVIDQTGKIWICTVAATPGTWVQVGGSGSFVDLTTNQTISGVKTFDNGVVSIIASRFGASHTTFTDYASFSSVMEFIATAAATATNVVVDTGYSLKYNYWTGSASAQGTVLVKGMSSDTAGSPLLVVSSAVRANGLLTAAQGINVPSGKSMVTGTRSVETGTRTTTTQATDTVDLGVFSSTGGAIELRIHTHLAAPAAGTTASVSKIYEFAVGATMGTLNTWYKVLPADMSANQATSNDFALEVRRTAAGTFEFRFRQISIAVAGAITFIAETLGDTSVTFAPSTTVTTAPAAVTTLHPSNSLVTSAGNVGIGTDTPTTYPFEVDSKAISSNVGMLRSADPSHTKLLIRNDDAGTNVNIGLFGSTPGTGIFTEAGIAAADAFIATANTALRIGGFGQASHMRVSPTVTKLVTNFATTQGNTGANALQLHSEAPATAVNTLIATGRIEWKANYWNGTASVQSGPCYIAHTVTSTGGAQSLIYSASVHEFSGDPRVNDGTNTRSLPRGRMVFSGANNTASAAITTTEASGAGLADIAFTAVANRKYRIHYSVIVTSSVSNDAIVLRIRDGGASAPSNVSSTLHITPITGSVTAARPQRVTGWFDVDCLASGATAPAQINAGAHHLGVFLARDTGGTGSLTLGSASTTYLSELSVDDVTG